MHPYHSEFTPFSPTIGAVAFWAFVALITIAGTVRQIFRHRDIQATIRLAMERDQNLDPKVLEHLLKAERPKTTSAGMLQTGLIVAASGIGLGVIGVLLSQDDAKALYPFLGAGALSFLVGVSMLIGSRMNRKLGDGE